MQDYQQKIAEAESRLDSIATVDSRSALESIRKELLGKGGLFPGLLKGLKDLPDQRRREVGRIVNELKDRAEKEIDAKLAELSKSLGDDVSDLDYTLPGRKPSRGRLHLLTRTTMQILDVFRDMGFHIVEGPDIEDEWHNFDALRLHADHPARDTQDSFSLGKDRHVAHADTLHGEVQASDPDGVAGILLPSRSVHQPTFTGLLPG
jgi:phenylalanyl-tRNA synthetase alpha chain